MSNVSTTTIDFDTPTYTTFSGADAVLYMDEEQEGAISSIRWVETSDRKLEGTIVIVLFDADHVKKVKKTYLYRVAPADMIHIKFANEYGQRMEYKIKNPKFHKAEGGISVDDINMEEVIYFTADSLEVL